MVTTMSALPFPCNEREAVEVVNVSPAKKFLVFSNLILSCQPVVEHQPPQYRAKLSVQYFLPALLSLRAVSQPIGCDILLLPSLYKFARR